MRSLTVRFLGWALARMAPAPSRERPRTVRLPESPHPHGDAVWNVVASSPSEAWAVITEAA